MHRVSFASYTLTIFLLIGSTISPASAQIVLGHDVVMQGFDVSQLVPKLLPTVVSINFFHYVPAPDGSRERKPEVGTGYIVDPEGLILTARHVVEGAEDISVTLSDGQRLQAALAYRSPDIDMAVLRVRPSRGKLPTITWGDSDTAVEGSSVIAIGNPLGLGFTVTHGMVSALDRSIRETPLDNFMQIDAPINPGNSGGPLFNLSGEVIGQNTALETVSGAGGSVGLNFALPSDDVRFVMDELKMYGRVRVGYFGAVAQDMTQTMANALGLLRPQGVVVVWVQPGSPAAEGGLKIGDVIQLATGRSIAGQDLVREIDNVRGLRRVVEASEIGAGLSFQILRAGAKASVTVKTIEKPADPTNEWLVDAKPPARTERPDLGLTIDPITDALRRQYGIPATINGMVITDVLANTMGADLGLKVGTVILRIDDSDIDSRAAMQAAVQKARSVGHQDLMALIIDTTGMRWIGVPVPPPG